MKSVSVVNVFGVDNSERRWLWYNSPSNPVLGTKDSVVARLILMRRRYEPGESPEESAWESKKQEETES